MIHFPVLRVKFPQILQARSDTGFVDVSLSRVLPLAVLLVFGILVGLVFQTGISHPYDKIIHIGFFALFTLSIHALFRCRLRISAVLSFGLSLAGELVQGFLPHHHMSLQDAFANAIGVALIVALIALIRSETRQALADPPQGLEAEIDLMDMGLKPVPPRYRSGSASRGSDVSSDR